MNTDQQATNSAKDNMNVPYTDTFQCFHRL